MNCAPITFEQLVLPKNPLDSVQLVPLSLKIEEGAVISSNGHDTIFVTNYSTLKRYKFGLYPVPTKMYKTLSVAIDTLYIESDYLYITYQSRKDDEGISVVRRFLLKD